LAQDGRESGHSNNAHPARGPPQGGSTQVVKKLYQSSKPGEAKPRQSIGATKSALGAQGKEHQNKDLVQLELTINSSPYNGAESTSRQNRTGAANGDKDEGGMKRNSSLDTHPMP